MDNDPTTKIALPAWDEMSDLDKGAALLHNHERDEEGVGYATEHYPCRYIDDPRLIALDRIDASNHAAEVCGSDAFNRLGDDEYMRLYELALDHEPTKPITEEA
jgi:hypothetical protein